MNEIIITAHRSFIKEISPGQFSRGFFLVMMRSAFIAYSDHFVVCAVICDDTTQDDVEMNFFIITAIIVSHFVEFPELIRTVHNSILCNLFNSFYFSSSHSR